MQIPLAMVADVKIVEGPAMIKSENGMLRNYVQLNVRDRDIVGFVEEAQRVVAQKVKLPQGMYLAWSGQFENQVRAGKTMQVVFPAVVLVIFIILYLTYNDFVDAVLMMMCVPEALVGGVFFLWLFDYHFSVAVQVGFIACFGMATETGIIMLVYLREAMEKRGGLEKIGSLAELRDAVIEGAVHRLRPKLLTEGVAIIALAPMLWATGVGHEVISAMAAPVLGGLLIADEVVDIFIPVRFYWVRRYRWLKMHGIDEATAGYDQAIRPRSLHENRLAAGLLPGREGETGRAASGNGAPPKPQERDKSKVYRYATDISENHNEYSDLCRRERRRALGSNQHEVCFSSAPKLHWLCHGPADPGCPAGACPAHGTTAVCSVSTDHNHCAHGRGRGGEPHLRLHAKPARSRSAAVPVARRDPRYLVLPL